MIKAVIFDVDGTLLDSFEANLKFYQDLMTQSGYGSITRGQYAQLTHLSRREMIRSFINPPSDEEMTRVWALGEIVADESPAGLLHMPKDAGETVKLLSEKYLLGIATSGLCDTVYKAPELSVLRHHFRATVCYEDTVNHKPNPEPLLLAAQRLGVSPDEAVYVGDTQSDLQAARSAGMRIIMYGKVPVADADGSASSFKELPTLTALL